MGVTYRQAGVDIDAGERLVERLKAHPRFGGIPAVLMSGDVHELRRLASKVDGTIAKPFTFETLHAILTELCSERRQEA